MNKMTGHANGSFTSAFRETVKRFDQLSDAKKDDVKRTKDRLLQRQQSPKRAKAS